MRKKPIIHNKTNFCTFKQHKNKELATYLNIQTSPWKSKFGKNLESQMSIVLKLDPCAWPQSSHYSQ